VNSQKKLLKIEVEKGFKVKLLLLDADFKALQNTTIEYHVFVQEQAEFTLLIGLADVCSLDLTIRLYLQSDCSKAEVFGVYGLSGDDQVKIKTYQMHEGKNTKSSVLLKGMLKDRANVDIQGLIYIAKGASKADASQENKNIVCSPLARVISVPSIEVLHHDVQCCHGAAIGQFDEKHLWYLQSKGLNFYQVHQMLMASFFGQVVQKFDNPEQFMEKLCKKMI
jgi:Fe-S cluster assembly scaffold protein SufB